MNEDRGFLSRWSRRKRAAEGAAARVPSPAAPAAAVPPEGAAAADVGRPVFDPASLPPVEDLTAGSDFAAFLREEVPAALRRAALRRAWTLDPAIRDFVGPADYAWDFNAPGSMPGFSFELAGDLDRLLAQAIGAAEEASEGERPEEAPAPVDAPAAPDAPVAAEIALPRLEDAPPVAAEAPGPGPGSAEAPVAAPSAAPRRRHGGALPS